MNIINNNDLKQNSYRTSNLVIATLTFLLATGLIFMVWFAKAFSSLFMAQNEYLGWVLLLQGLVLNPLLCYTLLIKIFKRIQQSQRISMKIASGLLVVLAYIAIQGAVAVLLVQQM